MSKIDILQSESVSSMVEQINSMLSEGWEISGELIITQVPGGWIYTQRMVNYDYDDLDSNEIGDE
jgi:hypothetical protein